MKPFFKKLSILLIASIFFPFSAFAIDPSTAKISDFEKVFAKFVSAAIGLVALISVAMFVMGGIKYLTAGADKEGAASAQHTITYGIVGLIVTMASWIILGLVGSFLGLNLSVFKVTL
jgi:hypothetical protein